MSKYKKFAAWGEWNIATLMFAICLVIVPFAVAVTNDSTQGRVTGLVTSAAAVFAAIRYFQWRQEYGREFVYFNSAWGLNVWCTGVRARERWNFGVGVSIIDAMNAVSGRLGSDTYVYLDGMRIEIVDKPFNVIGMDGLQSGVYFPDGHSAKLSWPEANLWPPTIHHELLHAVLDHRDKLDGNAATHAKMREMADSGLVPREWA